MCGFLLGLCYPIIGVGQFAFEISCTKHHFDVHHLIKKFKRDFNYNFPNVT